MNIFLHDRVRTILSSGLALASYACQGQLAVVDDLDTSTHLLSHPLNEPSACGCASSASLMPLLCDGREVPLFDNDIVQTTSDGSIAAFNVCDETGGECQVIYWDGGLAELPIASGLLLGMSASGAHVLTSTPVGMQVIDLNGTSLIPLHAIAGRGSLSASGDTVIGTVDIEGVPHLARAGAGGGEPELLGPVGSAGRDNGITRAFVNADASAIVGFTGADQPYRYQEPTLSIGLPGAPSALLPWPEAVSGDGSVIAGRARRDSSLERVHFRWTEAEGFQILASSSWGTETLMSVDGSVVLGSLDPEGPDEHAAFRWTAATGAVEITPGVASSGTDISDDGSVVVATSWEEAQFADASPEATFVWDTTHGTRNLKDILVARGADTTGWEFGHARALSGDGKVLLGRARCGGVPTLYRIVLSD